MDDITLVCPNCQCTLGLDDAGDAVVLSEAELPAGTSKGLGGLRVEEASPGWKERAYQWNQVPMAAKPNLKPPTSFAKEPVAVTPDDEVVEANEHDLKQRGF